VKEEALVSCEKDPHCGGDNLYVTTTNSSDSYGATQPPPSGGFPCVAVSVLPVCFNSARKRFCGDTLEKNVPAEITSWRRL